MDKNMTTKTTEISSELRQRFRLREEPELWRIIGSSKEIKGVLENIQMVLDSDVPVIIQGETGTGKELVAQAVHYRGMRSKRPFYAINCAAIPENLIESELFGYEKGSFTGATQQYVGKFERASGGTLFLDEVNGMSLTTQAKILRVIEEQVFERVGGTRPIKTDVRIVSASNQDLLEVIGAKNFREDLYYRIAVFKIDIPPLRERREDIPELVHCFVKRYNTLSCTNISNVNPKAMEKLVSYHWPGNIRQLQNAIRRAILIATSSHSAILPEHFDFPDSKDGNLQMVESLEFGLSKLEVSLKRGEVMPLNEVEA
ncbi:MAG: sigma-54-dependent Fis family transcriptional regulator, partial [Planctomycetes bacterium]|nr:sigma-54-dependent Fis family transcriptional regulator [Planctomycetota bacterium]